MSVFLRDCNYISWDIAVCRLSYLISDDFKAACFVEKGERVCIDPSSTMLGSEWMVQLPPLDSDGFSSGDDEWDELAEASFDFHFKSFLETSESMKNSEMELDRTDFGGRHN